MPLPKDEEQRLLNEIMETEGYGSLEELLEKCLLDTVCPCICTFCGTMENLEPDQVQGWCESCDTPTMVSALILAGVI